jgi:prolyl 4-hydroxylase
MRNLRQDLKRRRVLWLDNFISDDTCAKIRSELEYAHWRPSTVVSRGRGGNTVVHHSRSRLSESAMEEWFSDDLARIVAAIDRRLVRMLRASKSRYESWQAIRYGKGGKFDYHYDSGYWRAEPGAERQITVLLYLNTPRRGGSTHFRELALDIEARAGRLVLWENLLADGERDPKMIHCSVPLQCGRKLALVTWIRQRPIRRSANGYVHDGGAHAVRR